MGALTYLSDKEFDEKVIKSNVPVLIDFFADWCMPCKMVEPHVIKAAENFVGKINVFKVNVDDNPATAGRYHIMSIPTMLIFKDGKPIQSIVGAVPYNVIEQKINSVLEG